MPRGSLGHDGIIPACAGNTVFDALTHDAVPLHEHFERQRVRFAEVATARDLVPLRGLELVRLDGRRLLEQHREPLFGNKKAAPKDGLRGGRICTYVSSIKGTPRTVLLSALPIFPYVRHPINHGPLIRRKPCCAFRRIVFVMVVAMMRMRLLSFMGVVYVYLFRSLVLVVEMHDRLQIIAFHMSINAPASHCLHEGGLSPRVRGTRQLDADRGVIAGIIPACAGNTRLARSRTLGSRDHPRVCGEHLAIPRPSFPLMGSSPRVRGTLAQASDGVLQVGIIPACAGNTRWRP